MEQYPYRYHGSPGRDDGAGGRDDRARLEQRSNVHRDRTLTPAQTWYLAEGSTAHGFDTYVLMANPNAAAATVTVVYNTSLGRIPRALPITVPADSRVTLHVSDDVPNVDVSTTLQASVPIVAERAVYWLSLIHISEPTRLGMISYAVFCLKKKKI